MFATEPRGVGLTIVWPKGVIFSSMMTYHVPFLLLVLAGDLTCALQKVDPALIARFRPAMLGCFCAGRPDDATCVLGTRRGSLLQLFSNIRSIVLDVNGNRKLHIFSNLKLHTFVEGFHAKVTLLRWLRLSVLGWAEGA